MGDYRDKTESPQPEQSDQLIPTKTREEYLADVVKYCSEVHKNCAKVTAALEKYSDDLKESSEQLSY